MEIPKITVEIENKQQLDEQLEKAKELVSLLEKANELILSLNPIETKVEV